MTEELFSDNQYAKTKLNKAKEILRSVYYKESEYNKLIEPRDATADETGFQQLYFRHSIPKEWFTRDDVAIDFVFQQFGSNLARSEIHYIVDKIFSEQGIPRVDIGQNIRETVLSNIQTFLTDNEINALLAPINHYVDMHVKWPAESPNEIRMDIRTGELSFFNITPAIFWSNKYMQFEDFALIDKSFGQWVSKPSVNDRLVVKISDAPEEKLDLLFFVYMKFDIVNRNKILILRTQKPYLIV